MNKKIDDKAIDEMLKNYCTRKSQIAFDVDSKSSKSYSHKLKPAYVVLPAVAIVLVVCLLFTVALQNGGVKEIDVAPKGFTISASAAEREGVVLQNVEVMLSEKDKYGEASDIMLDDGGVCMQGIWFHMNGKNIETFDYKCENGVLNYVIPDIKDEKLKGDDSITQDDYFKMGKELKTIPYDNTKSNYIFVSWNNLSIDDEMKRKFGDNYYQEHAYEEINAYRKEILKTNEDFNKYFADTITITAHYKDGSQETAIIDISIDTWEDGDKIFGNYVLKYK